MYGTKNMANAVLYFVPTPNSSSEVNPNTFAFPILTLIVKVRQQSLALTRQGLVPGNIYLSKKARI